MTSTIHIRGDFLEIYPYMNWLFLVTHEGDLLVSRTEQLIEERSLHDHFFRHAKIPLKKREGGEEVELDIAKFRKIATLPDQFSFSDLRFFYSNIICASNEGLHFLPFETNSETVGTCKKVTDVPISSIAAKYMTIFATSLEDAVTTLFGVKEGGYSHVQKTGSQSSRVGISLSRVHFYMGATDLMISEYERRPVEGAAEEETDLETIEKIEEARPYELGADAPDFVFNSNNGIFLKFGKELRYRKEDSLHVFKFQLENDGKLIRANLHKGGISYEFMDGLFLGKGENWTTLLEGECISTRGYSNSINYQNSITAVNEQGAYLFVI